jgi:muramoyltetrapeptide carboxypeptidase
MTSTKSSRLIIPPFLEPGDTIGIATPASTYDRDPFEAGLAILRQWGYPLQLGRRGIRKKRYLAGSDAERAEELMDLFQDPAIKAILCARGGYGAMRLLDRLDFPALAKQPKMFIGFSDITVLLLACFHRAKLLTFHGPMVTTLARLTTASRDQFRFTLRGVFLESLALPRQGKIKGGRAQGLLLGGNLTLLAHLIGTPFEPDWDRAILFVEDEGEPGYRIDRLFVHLRLSGVLGRIRGLLLGRLGGAELTKKDFEVIRETFSGLEIPIWQGLPFGHGRQNVTLPVGAPVELDGERGLLTFPW